MKYKLTVFIAILAFAALLSGCSKKVSEAKAKKYMLSYLKQKYDEQFEITGSELENNNTMMVARYYYRFDAKSEDTGVTFTCNCDAYRQKDSDPYMTDNYEKALYQDAINKELSDVETNADGWTLRSIEDQIFSTHTGSHSYEEFKNDADKNTIFIKIDITADDPYTAASSIYDYLCCVRTISKYLCVDLYYPDKDVVFIKVRPDSDLEYKTVLQKMQELWG